MLDGECVDSCPATLSSSGTGLFGRRCHDPFTCQGGSIITHDVSYGCKCAADDNTNTASCHRCEHRAGEYGQHCLRCKSPPGILDRRSAAAFDAVVPGPGASRYCLLPCSSSATQARPSAVH